jgi:hypothetical protein
MTRGSWTSCHIGTDAAKSDCRSWFAFVLSDDQEGPIRAAIHETSEGRETELRAIFVKNGKETEFRRRRQKGGRFTIVIRDPAPWPVK